MRLRERFELRWPPKNLEWNVPCHLSYSFSGLG
jgi:hypothetical protein